jgi:hypothetical protein
MVNSYVLVNPHIEGKFKSKIKAKNSLEASHIFYKNLSEHFNNSVPNFHFSIQKGSSMKGGFYHFKVKESRENDAVNFTIAPYKVEGEQELMESFSTRLANFKTKFNQDGGKKSKKSHKKSKKSHHKKSGDDSKSDSESDSSSSSSSDSSSDSYDFYRKAKASVPINQPIYYWWYDPYIYRLDSLYIPTFYSYVTPYIELSLKL